MSDNEMIRQPSGGELSVNDVLEQVKKIQAVMQAAMRPNEHYGVIPGTKGKPTLLQPGAQKLSLMFRLAPEYTIIRRELSGEHVEYEIICRISHQATGAFVGFGVGLCSTMESKYRYRGGAFACPHCGATAIIKGKADFGGGWFCWAKKGGCGAKFPDDQFTGVPERIENPDLADTFNTVLKIAKKRAFVDAVLTATAASDIFTQDLEEHLPEDFSASGNNEGDDRRPVPTREQNAGPAPAADSATKFWTYVRVNKFDKAGATKIFEDCGRNADQAIERLRELAQAATA